MTRKRKISSKEKVLVILIVSDSQIDDAEEQLNENKYFGYKGIICVSQVIFFSNFLGYLPDCDKKRENAGQQ